MPTIVVETGSVVTGANSYVSVADARLYAADRGVTLPVDDDDLGVMLIKAADYLETFACEYQGSKVSGLAQPLEWPRTGVSIHGDELPSTVIPRSLINAQLQAMFAVNSGVDLQPVVNARDYVIREKVGDLEVAYANPLSVGIKSQISAVESLLAPLFGSCGASMFQTVRV